VKRNLGWVKGAAKYAIGFGLLAFVVWRNWEPKGKSPGLKGLVSQTPDAFAVAAVAGLCAVAIGLQFLRWYYLVRAVDLPFTKRNAFRLGLVGYFYSQFLPGSIAGDFVKAYFIAREQPHRKAAAVATVVVDRLFGLFGLLLLAALFGGGAWLAGDERVATNGYLRKIVAFSGGAVAAALAGWVVMGWISDHFANAVAAKLHRLPKVGKSLAEVWYAVRLYRHRPKAVALCVLISAGSHTCMVLMFHMAVRVFPSLAADAGSFVEHFVVGPIGFIAQVFFPAPGGVGGAEAIFGYLYTLIGRDETTGVVGRLAFRAVEWTFGLIGYLTFLRMKDELPAEPVDPPNAVTA
jgi:uncharacterized membrane protein YbhN (UPF0104 family)